MRMKEEATQPCWLNALKSLAMRGRAVAGAVEVRTGTRTEILERALTEDGLAVAQQGKQRFLSASSISREGLPVASAARARSSGGSAAAEQTQDSLERDE